MALGRIFFLLVILCLQLTTNNLQLSIAASPEYDPHAIIVKFKPGVISLPLGGHKVRPEEAAIGPDSVKALNNKYKVKLLKKIFRSAQDGVTVKFAKHGRAVRVPDLSGYYDLYLSEDQNIEDAINEYRNDPNVESVGYDYLAHCFVDPSDTDFGVQWGLKNIGQSGGTAGDDVDASHAWNISKGTNEVIIAVVDSGADTDHPDLFSKIITLEGCNKTDQGPSFDPNPISITPYSSAVEHGTHVAGIVGAITDNPVAGASGGSVAGLAWNPMLMPVKVIKNNNSGSYSDVAAGIVFAADNGADVINMSFGGPYDPIGMQAAIDYAYANSCVLVAAAGNEDTDISLGTNRQSPVCNDGAPGENKVIGVAATNNKDEKSWYSNYSSLYVDVSAPGGETFFFNDPKGIYSTVFYDGGTYSSYYKYFQGTSMAAPFVSGLAALIKSQHLEWTNAQIIQQIMGTADYIDDNLPTELKGKMGSGRINAFNALNSVNLNISSPLQGSRVYWIVDITGTASWDGVGKYEIAAAEGLLPSPSAFVTFHESAIPVADGLLAQWDTTGSSGDYTIRLSVLYASTTIEVRRVVRVGDDPNRVKLVAPTYPGPNPYNPDVDPKCVIRYQLSAPADVRLLIYNMSGVLLWQKSFMTGSAGGMQGDNYVDWNGKSMFNDAPLSGGIYLYSITSAGRVLGRGKILIAR